MAGLPFALVSGDRFKSTVHDNAQSLTSRPRIESGKHMDIFKQFTFEAAHRLPNVPEGHKCARLHGHSYRIEVHVSGEPDDHAGWVMDFGDIATAVAPVISQLDHYYLNDIKGLENPTSENIARWLWPRIREVLPALSKLVIRETCTSGCVYTGD